MDAPLCYQQVPGRMAATRMATLLAIGGWLATVSAQVPANPCSIRSATGQTSKDRTLPNGYPDP